MKMILIVILTFMFCFDLQAQDENTIDCFLPTAKVLESPKVIYPNKLSSYGKKVKVIVAAMVDTSGICTPDTVLRSDNPDFNKYALDLIPHYRIKVFLDDKPIAMRISIPILFVPDSTKQ